MRRHSAESGPRSRDGRRAIGLFAAGALLTGCSMLDGAAPNPPARNIDGVDKCTVEAGMTYKGDHGYRWMEYILAESLKGKSVTSRILRVAREPDGTFSYSVNGNKSAPQLLTRPGAETGQANPDAIVTDIGHGDVSFRVDVQAVASPSTIFAVDISKNC